MRAITLAGFEDTFLRNPDPWQTWTNRDEALKRAAILQSLPRGVVGRTLELGAGNGSNSRALAARSLRLDATEATGEGTKLVSQAIAAFAPRARAVRLTVPQKPPRAVYDVIVIAELLYYLNRPDMRALARQISGHLRGGGILVLAHHRITFHDFAQRAQAIHARFLLVTGRRWRCRVVRRTGRWIVVRCQRQQC